MVETLIASMVERLRVVLIFVVLAGIVVLDSFSRIISMCIDGILVAALVALLWPFLKSPAK